MEESCNDQGVFNTSKMTELAEQPALIGSNGTLTVVERLSNLLETGQFSDFTFKVGSGDDPKTFKAHQMLLATASQPLHSLVMSCLQHQNGMTDNMTLSVTDIDPESFQHILKYIYTDDVRVSSIGEAINLMKYSDKWCLDPLGQKTIKFVNQFLDEFEPFSEEMKNDICVLLIWSEGSNNEPLTKRIWDVMMRNINEIVPCQAFLGMDEDMVRKLLTHEKFSYKNQLMLFEAIRDWGMNQILTKHMNVNQLQSVIAGLLQHINFKDIGDGDFASTIMPSECLGRAELIAFFLCRGQDMPRELAVNNNNSSQVQNVLKLATNLGQEKACRCKKGYRVQESEVYNEHELRFRADRDICLLGIGFGFLFSDVDMGVTVHCKGPWEVRQWTDLIQTYCRVTWDQMTTTNVKLMFSEPVIIQANHSYKILAKIGRMSAGASDVELWGGCEGLSIVEAKDVRFDFLKNAVPPHKEVEDKDRDDSACIITDLIYQLEFDPLTRRDPPILPPIKSSTVIAPIDMRVLDIKPFVEIQSPTIIPTKPLSSWSHRKNLDNKENILPHRMKEQQPELPWIARRTTIINNREEKPLISPFKKSRPSDPISGDKVTLPWQRKSSISTTDGPGSFLLRSKPLSPYTPLKTNTKEVAKTPWSVELRSRPSTSSILNSSDGSAIARPRDTSASSYKNFSSGSTNFPRSGYGTIGSKETDKYSTPLSSFSSTASKYSNPSNRISQPSKDYSSASILREGYSKRPSAFSSSYENPSGSINKPSSYSERPRMASTDNYKFSSTSSKPSSYSSSYDNVPYRSTLNRASKSKESASRINNPTTTDNSLRYPLSNGTTSKYGQPSSSNKTSALNNYSSDDNTSQSKPSQPYSSIKSAITYSPYNNYRSNDSSSNRSKAYSPAPRYDTSSSSTANKTYNSGDSASNQNRAFSPAPRHDARNTSSISKSYPYSSKISSIASKWQPPSSGSSYYRR